MLINLISLLVLPSLVASFLEGPNEAGRLELTSTVASIEEDTGPLVVNCSFIPSDQPEAGRVVMMKFSRRSAGESAFVSLAISTPSMLDNRMTGTNGVPFSTISEDGSLSILLLQFEKAKVGDRGDYKCEVLTKDSSDNRVTFDETLRIGPVDNDASDLSNCFGGDAWPSSEVLKESLLECGASEEDWFQVLRDLIDLKASPSSSLHGVSPLFDSNTFYVFTTEGLAFDFGVDLCKENYGYLAELNTEEEFLFLNESFNFLRENKEHQLDFLATGASYETLDGEFEFFTHPDAPMYLGHWEVDEPSRNDLNHNWLLIKVKGGVFEMVDGVKSNWDLSYLCEISKDKL